MKTYIHIKIQTFTLFPPERIELKINLRKPRYKNIYQLKAIKYIVSRILDTPNANSLNRYIIAFRCHFNVLRNEETKKRVTGDNDNNIRII